MVSKEIQWMVDPFLVLALLAMTCFVLNQWEEAFGVLDPHFGVVHIEGENTVMVQDFSNLLHYVRGVLHRVTPNPYRVEEMNEMLKEWTGGAEGFMPFLSPPTIVLTFGLLSFLPPGIAYVLWMTASAVAAGWTVSACRKIGGISHGTSLILGALACLSLTSMMSINLGQTVFLTNAAFCALLIFVLKESPYRTLWWGAVVLMVSLSGKPQVALVAVIFMASVGQWRCLGVTALATLLFLLLVTPLFGWTWPLDYVHTMGSYGGEAAPSAIRETIGTTVMTNARAFLVEVLTMDDRRVVSLSWLLFLGGGGALILAGYLHRNLDARWFFAVSALLYLVFCPHLNPHEDLLLWPVGVCLIGLLEGGRRWIVVAALVLILTIQLNMDMGVGFTGVLRPFHHVFWVKLTLLALLLTYPFLRQRQDTEQETSLAGNLP